MPTHGHHRHKPDINTSGRTTHQSRKITRSGSGVRYPQRRHKRCPKHHRRRQRARRLHQFRGFSPQSTRKRVQQTHRRLAYQSGKLSPTFTTIVPNCPLCGKRLMLTCSQKENPRRAGRHVRHICRRNGGFYTDLSPFPTLTRWDRITLLGMNGKMLGASSPTIPFGVSRKV